jgi:hypothetical protein
VLFYLCSLEEGWILVGVRVVVEVLAVGVVLLMTWMTWKASLEEQEVWEEVELPFPFPWEVMVSMEGVLAVLSLEEEMKRMMMMNWVVRMLLRVHSLL